LETSTNVVEWRAGRLLHFKEQEVGERRLGAFDLGREHCFAPDIGVEEELGSGSRVLTLSKRQG